MNRLDGSVLDLPFAVARRQVEEGRVPFAILAVADAAGVIRLEATAGPQAPAVTADSQCLIASITKPIVATAAMRLLQDGRFPLEAPLALWLPELAGPGTRDITAWHVLSHTTGWADTWLERIIAGDAPLDRAGLLARAMAEPLATPVGTTYAYASITFDLLALAIERAVGRPFEGILRETVLDPLGMHATDWEPAPAHAAPVALLRWEEDWRPGELVEAAAAAPARDRLVALHLAGAGLHSTAADLVRFGRAMLRGGELDGARVLAPPFVALMTREVTRDGLGRAANRLLDGHYALGWGKPGALTPLSEGGFEHGGATGTRLMVDPARDLVLVYLTGVWGHPGWVVDEVVDALYRGLP